MSTEPRNPMERFDQELRRWAHLPPRRSAETAAAQVAARLDRRRHRRSPVTAPVWRLAAAAVALALVAGLLWSVAGPTAGPLAGGPRAVASGELAVPPLDPDVALIWLDRETPLYLSLTPPPAGGRGGSS